MTNEDAIAVILKLCDERSPEELSGMLKVSVSFVRAVIKTRVVPGITITHPDTTPPVLTLTPILTPAQEAMKAQAATVPYQPFFQVGNIGPGVPEGASHLRESGPAPVAEPVTEPVAERGRPAPDGFVPVEREDGNDEVP